MKIDWEKHGRMRGMLWGNIIGDALGSPVQFRERGSFGKVTDMQSCGCFGTPPGYWTDDGAMALCVAESFERLARYDLADIGENFVRWLDDGFMSSTKAAFDVGQATWASIDRIRKGSLANGTESSQGNGSIMRLAPSWIMNHYLTPTTNEILLGVSDLTHRSLAVHNVVLRMSAILDEHIAGKRTTAVSFYKTADEVNNSGWAVSTLEAALWAFNSTSTFEDALIAAVNLGGDADSIGAVTGQIAGAYYGYAAIPERWIRAIPKMNDMGSSHHGDVNHLFIRFLDRFYERRNKEEMLAREEAESPSTAH